MVMDGGIGQCKNPACMQVEALTADGFCSEDCRIQVTGCSVPDCGCGGVCDGVSRCTDCERYSFGVVDGQCPDCAPAITTTIQVFPGGDNDVSQCTNCWRYAPGAIDSLCPACRGVDSSCEARP